MMKNDLMEMGEQIEYPTLRQYLLAHHWQIRQSKLDDVGVFRSMSNDIEVIIPLDRGFADYGEAMITAIERIARDENRPVAAVINDLRLPRVDTLRFSRIGSDDDTLALDDGAVLVSAARKCIWAAACSVERPNERYHKRMSLKVAEDFLKECRLGQTESGSFIMTILCPLYNKPSEPESIPPFGRRSTEKILTSVRGLVDHLRRDALDDFFDNSKSPIITGNMLDALVEMMPTDERTDLRFSVSWSSFFPSKVIPHIQIDRDLFERIETVAQKLKPAELEHVALFLGRILELSATDNADGLLEGEETLSLFVEDTVIRARCHLGPQDYQVAGKAHLEQRPISLKGVLRRRSRSSFIEEPSELKIIDT